MIEAVKTEARKEKIKGMIKVVLWHSQPRCVVANGKIYRYYGEVVRITANSPGIFVEKLTDWLRQRMISCRLPGCSHKYFPHSDTINCAGISPNIEQI